MKKFNFKSLLVLVLALILVFSLVACNKDDGGSTPNKPPKDTYTAVEYFQDLWDASASIGQKTIDVNKDLAVSADMSLELNLKNSTNTVNKIDLGLALDLVLDRTEDSTDNTSARIKLYDPSSKENWATVYYFVNDVDANKVYIDFANQNIVLPLELNNIYKQDGTLDADSEHANAYFGTWINEILETSGANNAIDTVVGGMSDTWTLNDLISDICEVAKINLKNLLTQGELGETISEALVMLIGESDTSITSAADLFVGDTLRVDKLLQIDLFNDLFTAYHKNNEYGASLNMEFLGGFSMFIGDWLAVLTGDSDGGYSDLTIKFTEKDDVIDSFSLVLDLSNSYFKNGSTYPEIVLTINELDIDNANKPVDTAVAKANYSDEFILDAEIDLNLGGVSVLLEDDEFDMTGSYVLGLKGKVDLSASAENETEAYAYLSANNEKVVEASFAEGTLAVKVNGGVEIDETDVAYYLINSKLADMVFGMLPQGNEFNTFKTTLKAAFATESEENSYFATWTDINLQKSFADLVWNLIAKMPQAGTSVEEESSNVDIGKLITQVAAVVKNAIPYIKAPVADNYLMVTTNDKSIGAVAKEFGKIITGDSDFNAAYEVVKADKDDVLCSQVLSFVKIATGDYGMKALPSDAQYMDTYHYYNADKELIMVEDEEEFEEEKASIKYYVNGYGFLNDLFALSAFVKVDISNQSGIDIIASVGDKTTDDVYANIELTIGASAYTNTSITVLEGTPDFSYSFASNTVTFPLPA